MSVLPEAKKHLGFASVGVTAGASFTDLPTAAPVGAVHVTPAGCFSLLASIKLMAPAPEMVQENAPGSDAAPCWEPTVRFR